MCSTIFFLIQTGPNHLNKYYSWPPVVFIQVVWPGLYIPDEMYGVALDSFGNYLLLGGSGNEYPYSASGSGQWLPLRNTVRRLCFATAVFALCLCQIFDQIWNLSFEICKSRGFRNTPYMLNLMNFWPRYLRLKTIDTTSKFNFDSTFIASSDIEFCL